MVTVRPEQAGDATGIYAVHAGSFPTHGEARLVDALRASGRLVVSVVAVERDLVVGHAGFSPVSLDGVQMGVGLAPVAVLPAYRRRGIAADVIEKGIAACRIAEHPFIVLVGDPEYYGRFGFVPADRWNLHGEYGDGPEFQVLPLRAGAIPAAGGMVTYAEEFAAFDDGTD